MTAHYEIVCREFNYNAAVGEGFEARRWQVNCEHRADSLLPDLAHERAIFRTPFEFIAVYDPSFGHYAGRPRRLT
jgi:hypothetical protein